MDDNRNMEPAGQEQPADQAGDRHPGRGEGQAQGREECQGHHNRELGARGEIAAARYLERRGYEVLERNWTCPAGEADIIARDQDTVVFCEVKTRTNINNGFPEEAVDKEKRSRYEKIAGWYLRDYEYCDVPVRFDIVALLVISEDRAFIKHYCNAFGQGC